ncbi:hypothetical protein [Roseivivax sp. CAU 1753]
MRPLIALPALLLLSACLSPLERCVEQANRSLWAAEAELAELEATLARGYALETRESTIPFFATCYDSGTQSRVPCFHDVTRTTTRQVAVDLVAVRRRADALNAQIAALRPGADAASAQCRVALAGVE